MAKRRRRKQVTKTTTPFNSALESGLRALCVLYEGFPESYDSQRLIFYDYLVVHSGDVEEGPDSLHPATPFRSNEWLVRRQLVDQGLRLLVERGLVKPSMTVNGILYSASETAGAFVACLDQKYTTQLRERARWVVETFDTTTEPELVQYFDSHLDRWGAEFLPIGDWEDEV